MIIKKRELEFQINATKFVVDKLKEQQLVSFQSPTGSGKTLIVGMIIDKILMSQEFNVKKNTFIFIAPSTGKLDYQGYEKISNYLKRGWISGFDTEYIGTGNTKSKGEYLQNIDRFEPNKVYFIGWSLFGSNSNLSNMDSERNNIYRVIQNTKKNNTNIILIIDEAHKEVKNINSKTKKSILSNIDPYKEIQISATLDNPDYKVSLQSVRAEATIKKWVVVSCGAENASSLETTDEIEQLISAAVNKQKEVKEAYYKRNISNKPLILIQIPDKQKIDSINTDDYYLPLIKKILNKKKYSEGNNYAVWLSNEKTIKEKKVFAQMDSPIEILIFKQAIATGWDLPRANILIRIREPKSPKFDIQTLGRILRNPFFKYFDNNLIDNAFVFTRDTKYKNKILKENFVSSDTMLKEVKRSKRSKESTLKLNKIKYEKEINEKTLIQFCSDNILTSFLKEIKSYKHVDSNFNFKSFDMKIEELENVEKIESKTKESSQISISMIQDTLFSKYIKYKSVSSGKVIAGRILDNIIKLSIEKKLKNIDKKKIYNYIINNNLNSKYPGKLNLIEYIEFNINKYIKENSKYNIEEYIFPNTFKYKENFILDNPDGINSFDKAGNIDGLDSEIEKEFYKKIKTFVLAQKHIHLFKNGINKESYSIEYFNSLAKKSAFFPDFLLINEISKKVMILDTKGRNDLNIDKQSYFKFKGALKHINNINNNYNVSIYKVDSQKDDVLEFWDETTAPKQFGELMLKFIE